MHLTDGYYEIIGNVKEDKSVKALTSIELGPNLGKSLSLLWLRLLLLFFHHGPPATEGLKDGDTEIIEEWLILQI
jgi:hypothetical protein